MHGDGSDASFSVVLSAHTPKMDINRQRGMRQENRPYESSPHINLAVVEQGLFLWA